jgi:hypothetical protein
VSARMRVPTALLIAVALLVAGCSSGKKQQPKAAQSTAAPTTSTAAAGPLKLQLTTSARGPERGFNPGQAAKKVTPDLQRFLMRYLTIAFLQPEQAKKGWKDYLAMFDPSVRTSARQQLDALALGSAAGKVTAVRPGRAAARATVLFSDNRPARVHSTLQLLAGQPGWKIAAYDSKTGEDAR